MANSLDNIKAYATSFIGFDEANGNVYDNIGGYIGTPYNSPTRVTGWNGEGYAMSFNGSSQYIDFNATVIPIGAKSIRFRINRTSSVSSVSYILANANGSSNYGVTIVITAGNNLNFQLCKGVSGSFAFTTSVSLTPYTDGKWHDVLCTWDGTTNTNGVKVYIDDMVNPVYQTTSNIIETQTPTSTLRLGRSFNTTGDLNYFNGQLDQIEIYDRVISPIPDKYLVVHNGQYKYHNGTSWQLTTNTEANFIQYGMNDLSHITEAQWGELQGAKSIAVWSDFEDKKYVSAVSEKDPFTAKDLLGEVPQLVYYTDSNKEQVTINTETEPYSVYDHISETPELVIYNESEDDLTVSTKVEPYSVYDYISETPTVVVYTESTDDIKVSTTTEPYTLYDEFGDEVEVLYYTDDQTVNNANLILEANYSPLDELEGNFEVVTWTDDSEYAPILGITGAHIPLTINPSELIDIQDTFEKLMIYEDPESKDAKYLLTNNNSNWYKWDGINFIEVDINNIAVDGMTLNEINSADYLKWNKDRIGVSIYMSKDSVVSGLKYTINDNVNSPKVSNLHLYILNTTAKIDLELKGSTLSGQLSDDDLSKVQYRVILNGGYYYPNTGNFTALSDSPNNINLTFSSRDIKIDDWNDLTVEFKDSFGSVDYWNVQFIGKYNGLVFRTTDGQYYSTDLGEILSYLDFGMIIAGQSTLEHQVVLKNQYGETVKDANLSVIQNTLPKGVSVEFANDGVENWNKELLVSDKLESDEEVVFKVRMNTEVTAEPISNGTFEIFVNALKEE